MKSTCKKYLKLSLIITLYSGLSLLAINCDGTQSTQKNQGKKSQVTSIHEQVKDNALIERLKASPKQDYENIIKAALHGQSDTEKKKILGQIDENGSTIGHYLAAHSPLDVRLLREICRLDSENCTKINKNGEAPYDIAYANNNLNQEIVDEYLSLAGVGAKFKDGNNFLEKIVKSNISDRNNIILFILLNYQKLYDVFDKKTVELFTSNNFKNLDADLFSAIEKNIGPSAIFNTFASYLYKDSLAQLAKNSEIAKLIGRPDVKDANAKAEVNTTETGLYEAIPIMAPNFILDTWYTLRQILEYSSSAVISNGAVIKGLKLIHSPFTQQLLEALELYLERTRLEAIAAKNPLDPAATDAATDAHNSSIAANKALKDAIDKAKRTGPVPDFIEWSDNQKGSLFLAKTQEDADQIDIPNQAYLYDEKELLEKVIQPSFISGNFITAQTLESIPKDKITGIAYIFLNMDKAGWKNPIVGEVKYVNDRRYQFVGQPLGDKYGAIIGVDNFDKIYTPPFIGLLGSYDIKINKAWPDADQTKLASGAYGTVYEVKFNNRTFVAKHNNSASDTDKEIRAYERLHGIEGIGPYLGQIQNEYILLEKGEPLGTFAISHKNLTEPFMESLLKTMSEMHKRGIYHNDIKTNNIIVVNDKPNIIDFGNQSDFSWTLSKGQGFTEPYYKIGEETGVKADLKALGFVFFAIKYFGDAAYKDSFFEPERGKIILKNALKAEDIAARLEKGDKVDKVIANMLQQKYSNASEALLAL